MMKPEPSEVALRGRNSGCSPSWPLWSKKSLKNSSNGEPGGNFGRADFSRWLSGFTVCVVETLTTAGSSLSARSANPSGPGRAIAGHALGAASTSAAAVITPARPNLDEKKNTLCSSLQQPDYHFDLKWDPVNH